jgi:single-stranded-DNA-specific exonuclease
MPKYTDAPNARSVSPSTLTDHLLTQRGLTDPAVKQQFLAPNYDTGRHDPFLMPGMTPAVERVTKAINDGEHIAIYADYDCDGIPGAVLLHDFFTAIEHPKLTVHIPHRHYDGFGLNVAAVKKLAATGVTLMITVDCGTADVTATKAAKEAGVDVIVTDHHEPKGQLPDAVAIVNPKVGDTYPFPDLCGAGVAFKLVEALLKDGTFNLKPGQEKWWLDMVGLATISDMVPLVDENRLFAYYGLTVLQKSRRPGLQHLLRTTRTDQRRLSEDDIGFTIGPRINAASRMDNPEDAFTLLSTTDEAEAGARARHLEQLNNERKGVVAAMSKELKGRVEALAELPPVLVFGKPEWRPALVGLAANSLAGTYGRPAFIWGRDGNGVIKGSCRSEGETSVLALMEAVAESFLEHGGHHFSGGFSVKDDTIFYLPERLSEAFVSLNGTRAPVPSLVIDAYLSLDDVTDSLMAALKPLAPFGVGNEKPLLAFTDVTPERVEQFGKTKEHLKLTFATMNGPREAIAFFSTPEQYSNPPAAGVSGTLIAHLEESYFMNRRQLRLRLVDYLA